MPKADGAAGVPSPVTPFREDPAGTVIFVNPSAGGGKAARGVARTRAEFASRNFPVRLAECRSPGEFRESIRQASASGSKRLVAMGGDGTLQMLVREAAGLDLAIGVIPAGGGNDVARALGIRNRAEAIQAVVGGKTLVVDAVGLRFQNGETATYLGGGGVGLDAEAAHRAGGRFRRWPGRLRYLAAAIDALRGYRGTDVELEVRGLEPIRKRVLLAAALNTPSYGGGVKLAPAARVDDGELDFVLVEMLPRFEIARLLPGLILTGELATSRLRRFRASGAKLCSTGSPWFHGDGELLGKLPVEIEVLPRAVRMLVP